MNRDQLLNHLHYLTADRAKKKTKTKTLEPWETCTAEQGYNWAKDYLDWAWKETIHSKSQNAFFMTAADRVVARILMACFKYYTTHGFDWPDQPPFPDLTSCSPLLKISKLEKYTEELEAVIVS